MKKKNLLYRCRKNTKYNIDAFCRDCINGTIYSEFLSYGELNVWIPTNFLEENKVLLVKNGVLISWYSSNFYSSNRKY